jgi:hypothetical protein
MKEAMKEEDQEYYNPIASSPRKIKKTPLIIKFVPKIIDCKQAGLRIRDKYILPQIKPELEENF